MNLFRGLFKDMNTLDWVLAIAFIACVAYLVYLIFPPNGWWIGLVAALLLLFIAKRRRDRLKKDHAPQE